MIKTELYSDDIIRTYSDSGFKLKQDETDILYDEAYDPISMNRTYTETDIPIDSDDESEAMRAQAILSIILGENQ